MNTSMSMTVSEAKRDLTAFEEAMERLEKSLLVVEEVACKAANIRSTLVGLYCENENKAQASDAPRPAPLTYEQKRHYVSRAPSPGVRPMSKEGEM